MNLRIRDKVAIVTGAGRGLGYAVARSLAREGANLIICSRTRREIEKAGQRISKEFSVDVLPLECDITKEEDIKRMWDKSVLKFNRLDILFINTGGPPSGRLLDFSIEEIDNALRLNLLSVAQMVKTFLPDMLRGKWGRIIINTSSNVKRLLPRFPLSNISRNSIVPYAKTLALEVAPFGITVNIVAPGLFLTGPTITDIEEYSKKLGIDSYEANFHFSSQIPVQRIGDPSELGDLVAFLSSESASYITGEVFLIDGGEYCYVM